MGMLKVNTVALLSAATATGAGESMKPWNPKRSFQVSGSTSAGAGAATVKIQVSNDESNWLDLSVHSLTLATTAVSEGLVTDSPWLCVRANVTAISGTGAAVTVVMGSEGD